MSPKQKQRLQWIVSAIVLLCAATALVLYALSQNINLFFTPTQVVQHEAPHHRTIRLGGMVETHSVKRHAGSLDVRFRLTDFHNTVEVFYSGILPDLFREGQGIVAQGQLDASDRFIADTVLAKHDENYMPPELANIQLQKAQQ